MVFVSFEPNSLYFDLYIKIGPGAISQTSDEAVGTRNARECLDAARRLLLALVEQVAREQGVHGVALAAPVHGLRPVRLRRADDDLKGKGCEQVFVRTLGR